MLEKQFQTAFKRSFALYCKYGALAGHYHKIVDAGFLNPYDCYTVTKFGFVAHELKVNRQKNTFNFYQLFGRGKQYHEITNLKRVRETGHRSWVVIAHKQGTQFKAYAVYPEVADRLYKLKKGVRLEEIYHLIEIPRIKNQTTNELLYDLAQLM